jgi:hypothetical protein
MGEKTPICDPKENWRGRTCQKLNPSRKPLKNKIKKLDTFQ